jgi:4-diphosphocytidyl-2-C-methyl-D-erythritol kinase
MIPSKAADPAGHWWPAPAKLNLFLHITGRRPDGYHELQTLFQLLDWGDQVFIRPTASRDIVRRAAQYDVPAGEDLAVRAAQRLQAVTNCQYGAEIEVAKQIPMGSGLGGGSSDAATVLLALNHLWECGLSLAELGRIGVELGADVPVFVQGRTALATGIGDRLTPLSLEGRHYLLLLPEFPVSTAEVFAAPDLERNSAEIPMAEVLAGSGRNDCEAVARRLYPALTEAFETLAKYGRPRMSGTGSAVFVQMPSHAAASNAASDLKCRYNVRAVGGVDQSPVQKRLLSRSEK